MKKFLLLALLALCYFVAPAHAQQPAQAFIVSSCGTLPAGLVYAAGQYGIVTMDTTGTLCTAGGGGGGGGLSVVDGAAFTAGISNFTPSGGEYNSSPTALTSGKQGTLALDQYRAAMVDVPTANNTLYNLLTSPPPLNVNTVNTAWTGLAQGTIQTGTVIAANVVDTPANATFTDVSASTSGTPSTATTLLAASAAHHKVTLHVEGAGVVCFSKIGTAVIGQAGTWCLGAASSANNGTGGAYTTPNGQTDTAAFSMISTTASVLVTAWWQ